MAAAHHPTTGRPRWMHDVEAVVCAECRVPFGTLRRKHHCRSCGRIFCERCSHQRLLIPGDAMARPRKQPATALAPREVIHACMHGKGWWVVLGSISNRWILYIFNLSTCIHTRHNQLDPRTPQRVCPPCAEELVALQEELRRTVSRASQVCMYLWID